MALITFHQTLTMLLVVAIWSTSRALTKSEPRRLLDEKASSTAKIAAKTENRENILKENLDFIEKFNANSDKSFKLKANKFANLSNEEFNKIKMVGLRTLNLTKSRNSATMSFSEYKALNGGEFSTLSSSSFSPPSIDWRNRNAVNPVREQGKCSSCWAFATVAAVEAVTYLKTGKLPKLSEQQLVDCIQGPKTFGCQGGNPDDVFNYIHKNGGIASASSYPYKGQEGPCLGTRGGSAASVAGFVDVPRNNEEAIKFALLWQPVVTYVDSRAKEFQFYGGGVYNGPCGYNLDHLVALVGYGTTREGVPYWLVRNSWGPRWGEGGYMRLQRNAGPVQGKCGVAMFPSFPVV